MIHRHGSPTLLRGEAQCQDRQSSTLEASLDTLILILSGLAFVAFVVAGVYLWWPSRHDLASRSSIGAALLTGAVVAFAIFMLQVVLDARLDNLERAGCPRACGSRPPAVLVASSASRVGTSGLNGFDFHVAGPDLSGFYFVNKILSDADFSALTLEGANFSGADLARAKLMDAELQGANFVSARLEQSDFAGAALVGADFTSACLRLANLAGADLSEVDLTDADLTDAAYDAGTTWPNGSARSCDSLCRLPERALPAEACR